MTRRSPGSAPAEPTAREKVGRCSNISGSGQRPGCGGASMGAHAPSAGNLGGSRTAAGIAMPGLHAGTAGATERPATCQQAPTGPSSSCAKPTDRSDSCCRRCFCDGRFLLLRPSVSASSLASAASHASMLALKLSSSI
eukprot:scaffold16426_cov109-Isochrysis_galbana.AAC.4